MRSAHCSWGVYVHNNNCLQFTHRVFDDSGVTKTSTQ